MNEEQTNILRIVSASALEFLGVGLMAGVWFFYQAGPRFISLEIGTAALVATGWVLLRAGWGLR